MGSEGKIQKVNLIYLVGCNMVAPTSVMVLSVVLGVILPEQLGLILAMVGFVLAVCWWAFLGRKIYDGGKKKKLAQLEESEPHLQWRWVYCCGGPCAWTGSAAVSLESGKGICPACFGTFRGSGG